MFHPNPLQYSYVDTGNPRFVNMSYPGGSANFSDPAQPDGFDEVSLDQPLVVNDVYLLNQQLDASIHYKFAIVNGPTGEGVLGDYPNGYRSSPNGCNFTKIQLWKRYVRLCAPTSF